MMFGFLDHASSASHDSSLNKSQKQNKGESKSFMQAKYMASIQPTGGRIDINDLASPIGALRDWTFSRLTLLMHNLRAENEQLEKEMNKSNILQNISDWVDPNSTVGRGTTGSAPESGLYLERSSSLPPNRPFTSKEELRKVAGMTELIYDALSSFITVHGEKGININVAPPEVIKSLHQDFPDALVEEITQLTTPMLGATVFTEKTFRQFLRTRGYSGIAQNLMPQEDGKKAERGSYLIFDAPYNFTITSTGIAGQSQKTITDVYVDMQRLSRRFQVLVNKQRKRQGLQERKFSQPFQTPWIVYWKEASSQG